MFYSSGPRKGEFVSNKQLRKSRQEKEMNIKRREESTCFQNPLLYSNDLPFFSINYILRGHKDLFLKLS